MCGSSETPPCFSQDKQTLSTILIVLPLSSLRRSICFLGGKNHIVRAFTRPQGQTKTTSFLSRVIIFCLASPADLFALPFKVGTLASVDVRLVLDKAHLLSANTAYGFIGAILTLIHFLSFLKVRFWQPFLHLFLHLFSTTLPVRNFRFLRQ